MPRVSITSTISGLRKFEPLFRSNHCGQISSKIKIFTYVLLALFSFILMCFFIHDIKTTAEGYKPGMIEVKTKLLHNDSITIPDAEICIPIDSSKIDAPIDIENTNEVKRVLDTYRPSRSISS